MNQVNPIPGGYHAVTPSIVVNNATAAIEFYKSAFGAEEHSRIYAVDGVTIVNAELAIGDSMILIRDELPALGVIAPLPLTAPACALHLYVEDVDTVWEQAVQAGAVPISLLQDTYWGDRSGQLADPFGFSWSMASRIEKLSEGEIAKRYAALVAPQPETEVSETVDAA
ncbi:MAG: VOC family protein [Gammaproteobacteria bacterium]|nr:VOC family protein [Gammaproteobacteria bacterium]